MIPQLSQNLTDQWRLCDLSLDVEGELERARIDERIYQQMELRKTIAEQIFQLIKERAGQLALFREQSSVKASLL